MNIQLFGLRSLLLLAALLPVAHAAAPAGLQILRPDDAVLLKINFGLEWLASEIPAPLNAAYVIHNLPSAKRLATRYDVQLRETFRDLLGDVLQAAGYRGSLKLIEDATESDRGKPILIIDLKRWAVSGRQRFDCHFEARLSSSSAQANLGAHEYTDIQLHIDYLKGRHVGAERATEAALGRFLEKLAANGQIAPPSAGRN